MASTTPPPKHGVVRRSRAVLAATLTFMLGLLAPPLASTLFPRLASGWIEKFGPASALQAPARWQVGSCLTPSVAGFDGQSASAIIAAGTHERADELLRTGADPWGMATLEVNLFNTRSDAHIVVQGVRLSDVEMTDTDPDWVASDEDECGGPDMAIPLALHFAGGRGQFVAEPDDDGTPPFPFTVTPDVAYTLDIVVDADARTYDFDVVVDYLVNGSPIALTITKGDEPFRIVGDEPSTGHFAVWSDGTAHLPGGS
jgi:hypothetical protein